VVVAVVTGTLVEAVVIATEIAKAVVIGNEEMMEMGEHGSGRAKETATERRRKITSERR
jgi:hypothetical protein